MGKKKELCVVDLFAGAGGLSEGFRKAGFDIIAANEIEPVFVDTYKLNHPETKIFTGDIRNITVEEFKKECGINGKKIDVIIGGPPCQGFSLAGRRDQKDPRNSLFMEYVRFVDGLKPKFFVMENVPGILNMKTETGRYVKDIIIEEFNHIGYQVHFKKLRAADYGVPQKRQRVVFIGSQKVKNISFPEPTHAREPFVALNGRKMHKWVGAGSVLLAKHKVSKNYFHTMNMINGFRNRAEKNKVKGNGFGWQIIKKDEPSYTISARYWKDGSDALVRYSDNEIRMLTERECARIQTFPDDYKFSGNKRAVYMQIGNAVPVKLAMAIAENIKKVITDL